MQREKTQNLPIRRIFLDQYFNSDVIIHFDEFRFVYRFLKRFEINYEEDVLLMLESSPDALITMFIEFIDEYHGFLQKKIAN
jgi:hypothetical protein